MPIEESGQLKFIEHPVYGKGDQGRWSVHSPALFSTPFSQNISITFVDGHTASMMLPQIIFNGKTIVYMADLLPSAGHIPLPYVMAYDMFPLTTLNEKRIFLKKAADNNYILFFEHDQKIECCNLKHTERGIRMGDSFQLKDIT